MERLVVALADGGAVQRARARLVELRAKVSPDDRPMLGMLEARIAEAAGQPAIAHRSYMEALAGFGFPDDPDIGPWHRMVYRAARTALEGGDLVGADSLAGHALRLEHRLGHDPARSSDMRLAFLVQAEARLARGDTLGGRKLLKQALEALDAGLGPEHPRAREARLLAQSGGIGGT